MLVRERMTRRPITIAEDTSIDKALHLMRQEKIRRLPVVDRHGKLIGIVAEKDLLYASPSPATTLSIYEIASLLSKITVRELMTRDVITVAEDTPLEEAARIMADNAVGALPVLRGNELVGIITETDLFKIFLEIFGARTEGVRVNILVPEGKGVLAKLTTKIAETGGNILALGTLLAEDPGHREITIRVSDISQEALVSALEAVDLELKILDIRCCELPAC
jgi:acetoin utilization protein AcuB